MIQLETQYLTNKLKYDRREKKCCLNVKFKLQIWLEFLFRFLKSWLIHPHKWNRFITLLNYFEFLSRNLFLLLLFLDKSLLNCSYQVSKLWPCPQFWNHYSIVSDKKVNHSSLLCFDLCVFMLFFKTYSSVSVLTIFRFFKIQSM